MLKIFNSRQFMQRCLLLFLLLLAITGCSSRETKQAKEEAVSIALTEAAEDAPVQILMAGSSTVFPLAAHMAELYRTKGFDGEIEVNSIGSGGGFRRFCDEGASHIANASRPIKDGEMEACAGIGRVPIEFQVGTDALAVTVSRANTFIETITLEELALIYGGAETWSDVNPDWPHEPIIRFSPDKDSGTFDFFVEKVFDKDPSTILNSNNLQVSHDDHVLTQALEVTPYGIAYFGYAYYLQNRDSLRVLPIEGIVPSRQSAEDGSYLLSRPLYIYTDANVMKDTPEVGSFIQFFLNHVNQEIEEVGYFPLNEATIQELRDVLKDALE